MWDLWRRELLYILGFLTIFFLVMLCAYAWGGMMEQRPTASTIEVSIVYPDSVIIPVTISSVVPDAVPSQIILRVWRNGAVTTSHYLADTAGVTVARIARILAK